MSAASDKYERDVARYINKIPGVQARRPPVDVDYPDVRVKFNNRETWIEVKMEHRAQLANPRVFFDGIWKTTYTTPVAKYAIDVLNHSEDAKKFIRQLSKFTGIPASILKLPTTKGGYDRDLGKGVVPYNILNTFFSQGGRQYICSRQDMDMAGLATLHYTKGKTVPAYYMQAADDFYLISRANPLGLKGNIPLLSGRGDFKVRVSMTSKNFYEIQPEIKLQRMPNSPYSVMPNTTKKNPFL